MLETKTDVTYIGVGNAVPINGKTALSLQGVSKAFSAKLLFYDRVEQAVLNAQRAEKALAVLCVNLDGVKNGNAFPGAGGCGRDNDVLTTAEKRVSDVLRKSDTIVRTGRDECLILVQNLKNLNSIKTVADKVLTSIKMSMETSQTVHPLSVGIGCAVYPVDGGNAQSLIGNADAAAFRAKKNGGDKVVFYSNRTNGDILGELKLTNDMYHALERNEFELYYQPQIDSKFNEIVGLEALIRWNHPERGIIGPAEFIPIAEKTGLIMEIGEWVVQTACRQNKHWQDMGLLKIPIAVNLSARQFEDEHITKTIGEILDKTLLPAEYLEVEITESIAIRELKNVAGVLKQLKRLGIGIAVDDFGTAYSSLNYIKHLPIDIVKIDKCFVDGIGLSPRDEAILKTVIALIKNLSLKAVAEGVETKHQTDFLAEEGCSIIQGFYYYKPMPADVIEQLLGGTKKSFRPVVLSDAANTAIRTKAVNRYLDTLGVKHAHMGYRYLVAALRFGTEDPSLLVKISDLYEKVARVYGVKTSNIERSIRYSIVQYGLTSKEFISKAVDDITVNIAQNADVS